jgi:hypothetical protein
MCQRSICHEYYSGWGIVGKINRLSQEETTPQAVHGQERFERLEALEIQCTVFQ